ncbi:MAG: hypothetical protein PHP50_04095 [Lachnospiraceae bacterium]|nr:hypothetical protein [Lachnospiraceae bacterium]
MAVLLAKADGISILEETIFENRSQAALELRKMGAFLGNTDNRLYFIGQDVLHGTSVKARELRGAAALTIAGVAADGETIVSGYEYIRRGYEDICRDLQELGANLVLDTE